MTQHIMMTLPHSAIKNVLINEKGASEVLINQKL